jgi:benzoyl-CoA-dihydrodiol lyase
LVDEIVPRSKFDEVVANRAAEFAAESDRPANAKGVVLTPINRAARDAQIVYDNVKIDLDRDLAMATITISAPAEAPPTDISSIEAQGVDFWPFALARELDDAIMELRVNEKEIGTWVFKTEGSSANVEAADKALLNNADHWLVREITLYLKRTFKRIDVSSRSLIAQVEPGSCFTGTLLELVVAADRSFMLDGGFEGSNLPDATVVLTGMNFGPLVMPNGLTRLEHRFLNDPSMVENAKAEIGKPIEAVEADELGLVTFIPDDIDWEDEVRIAIEERASFSPDALTGMEASLRFAGPETLETKIFGRLSAWQNWIFQRPNAVGDDGALKVYGSGQKASYNKHRT